MNKHDVRLKEHEERLAKQNGIMEKLNEIMESLKVVHCEHLGWTKATHGIADASYFGWHRDEVAANRFETENFAQYHEMRRLVSRGISRGPANEPSAGTTMRRPMGIVIPESDGGQRNQREEDEEDDEVDPTDLRGKRPMGQKKKKSTPPTGTLTIATNNSHWDLNPSTFDKGGSPTTK